MHYLGVIDCNNFFVSCERLFRPDLRTRPVLVLSNNDGCVVARSQEVKDMGVAMGVPYFQIKDIVKDNAITCFSSHFALYRDISERVFAVVRQHFPGLEIYSIDEAFFEFESEYETEAWRLAKALKEAVERLVGVPVSVGLSDTKTRAKLVSKIAKKSQGLACLTGDTFLRECGNRPLSDVWGVGGALARRYRENNIVTIMDLLDQPLARVEAIANLPGRRLQAELAGCPVFLVTTAAALPKSVMSTRSFSKKTNDLSLIKDAVSHHVNQVFKDLAEKKLAATSLTVLLKTASQGAYVLRGGTETYAFVVPTASPSVCLTTASQLLDRLYEESVPYAKVGVVLGGLIPEDHIPQSLFPPASSAKDGIDTVLARLQTQFGDVVRLGKFSKERSWEAKRDSLSPAYTTNWSDIQTVTTEA